jgi:hypothetical protein
MIKDDFAKTYTYGMDGNDTFSYEKLSELAYHLADRGCGATQALTANVATGVALIGAGSGHVNVTSAGAGYLVNLPAVADVLPGHIVRGTVGANGFKLRVAVADDAVVNINNDVTTLHAVTIAAGAQFEARLTDATHWIVFQYTNAGAFTAPSGGA